MSIECKIHGHENGKTVREKFPEGSLVRFTLKAMPKTIFIGVVTGHLYATILCISSEQGPAYVFAGRCEVIYKHVEIKNK